MLINYMIIPGLQIEPVQYNYQMFLQDFSHACGFSLEELGSKDRQRPLAQARQIGMFLLLKNFNLTKSIVGMQFNRDHSTVIHAERTVENLKGFDHYFTQSYDDIVKRIKNKSGRPLKY